MEYWKWLWVVLVTFLLGGSRWWECEGCWEHEKIALLQLKPFFSHIEDVEGSWVEGNQSWDCCKWERVECNISTGRVIQLFLNLTYTEAWQDFVETVYADYIWSTDGYHNWHLNASLFLPFEELKSVYLGGNSIAGCVHNQGFERLSFKLDKLEILDLSHNYFNDSILASLSELSSLKSLNLGSNQLTGSNPTDGIKWLSKLNKLETLDLSGNTLENNILSHLGGFTSLKTLYLLDCGLKGTVDMLEFNNLKNLKELYLGDNEIESLGSLFQDKGQLSLTKLEVLGLSNNHFNNSIFSSLAALSNLKSLNIGSNKLKGAIHIEELNALSNLEELYMRYNEVDDFAPSQDNEKVLRLLNLEVLDLNGNLFNSSILSSLGSLSNLKSLYLYDNKLEGSIDLRGLHALRNLEKLFISCSFAEGTACSLPLQSLSLFPLLKTLFLEGFNFNGTITTQSNERELRLMNLEVLDLSENHFNSNILLSLGSLSNLKSLYLDGNKFEGSIDLREWQNLTNLEELTIRYSSLPSNVIQIIGTLPSLKYLDMSHCEVNGILNLHDFCELRQLQTLYIRNNSLKGNLPECFSNFTSLEYLDLSSNQFFGNIFVLKSLTSLQGLNLFGNNFQIPSSLRPLFNLSKLESIYVGNNMIYAETEMHSLAPTFQLKFISLSCCGDVGSFPQFLYHQHDLQYVDLSNIYFKGEQFPNWLLENNKKLEKLDLVNSSLFGHFELPVLSHTDLSYLDISKNSFNGNIPNEIGAKLPSLTYLNMSNNYFGDSIPVSIGELNSLEVLDLSNNKLTSGIPRWMGNMSSLEEIVMANNHLEGIIPMEFCQLNLNLKLLDLSVNNISGSLPSCFSPLWISQVHLSRNKLEGQLTNAFHNSTILVTLDLSNNHLTGNIPNWIGRLSHLSYLLLNNNHFEGEIPVQLCKLGHLRLINLSNNNLSGIIPPCLKITTLNNISQAYVHEIDLTDFSSIFSTEEPIEFATKYISYSYKGRVLTYLSGIDLSCNKLTGEIPHQVKNFQNIIVLNLSHNSLTGPIPLAVSDLEQIESLDLSYNKLIGKIPSQLVGLHFLSVFSVAYNNLSGSTPERTAQFATFEESSYLGNPFLCGTPLPKNCSTDGLSSAMPKASTEDGFIDMNVFYVSFVVSYVMVLLSIAIVLYINPYWRRAWFYHIEAGINSCYYFVVDNILPKRFH